MTAPRLQYQQRDSSGYPPSSTMASPLISRDRPRPSRQARAQGISRAKPLASWGDRQPANAQGRGGLMSTPDENEAMKKAWTYAVLDAIEAADENTRLEIARILCPAGFEIVEIEVTRAARKH